jgi:hypothetical protein
MKFSKDRGRNDIQGDRDAIIFYPTASIILN